MLKLVSDSCFIEWQTGFVPFENFLNLFYKLWEKCSIVQSFAD